MQRIFKTSVYSPLNSLAHVEQGEVKQCLLTAGIREVTDVLQPLDQLVSVVDVFGGDRNWK